MLELKKIKKNFTTHSSFLPKLSKFFVKNNKHEENNFCQAVRGLNLTLKKGEILALVGESGSGKSTLGRLAAGVLKPSDGVVSYMGQDLTEMSKKELKIFHQKVQMMFQDPSSALNPRLSVGYSIGEALLIHGGEAKKNFKDKVAAAMAEVGLDPSWWERYPYQFSGGQRQRISLARSLILDPDVLIADEPASALDVSIQAQIINLLLDLREKRNLSLMVISHDLPLVRMMADHIAVMYNGLLMEVCPKEMVGHIHHHPYVLSLWDSAGFGHSVSGEAPDPKNPPQGCPFHPRCSEASSVCFEVRPELKSWPNGLQVACHKRLY